MSKKIAILVEKQFEDRELWYPYYRMKEEGFEVNLIGPNNQEEFTGKYGSPAKADFGINDIDPTNYDAVIIPGGFAPDFIRRTSTMIDFVKKLNEQNKIIASICHGAWILASANVIKNKKITCFSAIKDDIINAGGLYEDSEVVKDGNIITSRKPDDLPAFCRTIIDNLTDNLFNAEPP